MEKRELLEQLFTYTKELPILDHKGEVKETLWQRLVGDNDLQKARNAGLRYSALMRKQLRNKDSDEYLIYIDSLTDLTKEELVNFILMEVLFEIRGKVERELYVEEPIAPGSGSTQEEQEAYVKEYDNFNNARIEKLNEKVMQELQELQTTLNARPLAEIVLEAQRAKENSLCSNRLQEVYLEMVAYLGTYTDETYSERVFPSYKKFINIAESLKKQVIEGYSALEISSVSLKESQNQQSSET